MKKTILLKISGAALEGVDHIVDKQKLDEIVNQVKQLKEKYNIAIVLGGGNVCRGNSLAHLNINKNDADHIGMLATIMNSLILENVLNANGLKAKTFSSINMEQVAETYNAKHVKESLNDGYICLLAAGTGSSYFTTDTGSILKALQIDCDFILVGKDGVDGVYSDDPNINKNAIHFPLLTYQEIIDKELKVMDLTALTLCKDHNIEILIFNMQRKNGIVDALNNKIQITRIVK